VLDGVAGTTSGRPVSWISNSVLIVVRPAGITTRLQTLPKPSM
jgi:hypothetical protein